MRRLAAAALTGAALLLVGGCGGYETEPDTTAVRQNGDYIGKADKKTTGCIPPSKGGYAWADDVYYYPAGQRTYTFRGDGKTVDSPALQVITKDNQTVTLSGTLYFYLTDDCDLLEKFHTNLGRKNWAGQPAYIGSGDTAFVGWQSMLDSVLGSPLLGAFQANSPRYETLPLYKNTAVQATFREAVLEALPEEIEKVTGGRYFGRFTLRLDPPTPPASTIEALDRQAAAVSQQAAQEAQNRTAATQYDTVVQGEAKGLTEATCALLYGINSGKVPYLTPDGGSVVLPGGSS